MGSLALSKVVEHRDEDIRQHVAGHENPSILDQQCRMPRSVRRMLDDPDCRAVPRNPHRPVRQTGDDAEQLQRHLLGDLLR